jgi:hypothetical protein
MYFNKVTSSAVSAVFLLLILSSVNFSSIKIANAAEGDLVNYNNNFDIYTSPNDPNKDSAMQNADCVVNFMQTYVYAASSAENCNNPNSTAQQPQADQNQIQGQPQYQGRYQPQSATGQGFQSTDGPQTGTPSQSGEVGVVKVVDGNVGSGTNSVSNSFAPVQSTPLAVPQPNNNDDDNNNDNDNNAKDNDNGDDNNNDNDNKVYNEKTVTKDERKLLLTACFERGYDKGDYLSTEEIVKCAENYNA